MNTKYSASLTFRIAMTASCIALAALLAGCGGSDTEEAGDGGDTPASGGTPAPAQATSGIVGTITLIGDRPERVVLQIESDPKCAMMHDGEPLLSDREIIGENGGIRDVFVYIKNAPEGDYTPPAEQAVMDQVACRYIPHVLGVMIGQEVSVRNSDPTLHNFRTFARVNRPFNNSQPEGAAPRIKKFDKVELGIRVKCDIHPWMTGFIFALDHPYFATTDENGSFNIAGLPDGEYTVVAWHEKYGEQEATVSFTDGTVSEQDFSFEATPSS